MITAAEVAALRTVMGLSQDHLADMLGVNRRTVRSWESGRDAMSPSSEEALRALVKGHGRLAERMLDADTPVAITRDRAEALPPRGWYLAAAGQALMADPDVMVDWA